MSSVLLRWRVGMVTAVAVACPVLVVCGGSGSDRAGPPTAVTAAVPGRTVDERSFFTIRPVLSKAPPPCSQAPTAHGGPMFLSEARSGEDMACVETGPAFIDANDVTEATARANAVTHSWDVTMSFTSEAGAAMDALAERRGVGSQVAAVVDGGLTVRVTVGTPQFAGKLVLSGMDQGTAEALSARFRHS